MKQIYLAISSDVEYLISELKEADKINEYTYKVINKKEIKSALKEFYFLLIVDQDHLDEKIVSTIMKVNKSTSKLWYIHSKYKNEITNHISTFTDIDSLIQFIQLSDLTNNSLFQNVSSDGDKENILGHDAVNKEAENQLVTEIKDTNRSGLDIKKAQPEPVKVSNIKGKRDLSRSDDSMGKDTFQKGFSKEEADELKVLSSDIATENNGTEDESKKAFYVKRAADIRKELFSEMKWSQNKTIGVWSPLHRLGTTTFIINFAIYLGRMKVNTTVIESLTKYQMLNTTLTRYKSKPLNWSSYIEALHDSTVQGKKLTGSMKRLLGFRLVKSIKILNGQTL